MSRPIQINMSAAGATWPMDVLPLAHPKGKKTCATLLLHYILPNNNEVSTKLNLIFYSICLRLIHSRPYHGFRHSLAASPVHVWLTVQMTANKGALEYWVSRRKGFMIFTLYTILCKRTLSVAPITRGIASDYFIMATNSLEGMWKKDVIAWLKALFQRLPASAEKRQKSA
jgi:hypothetical protein